MKFSYFTTLICGIICLVFGAVMVSIVLSDENPITLGGIIAISIFVVMGIALLISAFQIRKKIRFDKLAAQISEI